MATTFVKQSNGNVLITVGTNDPISAPGGAFISPHPSEEDVIMISEKFNPQNRDEALKVYVSDVTLPVVTDRKDLIEKLSTDFFFRVSGGGVSPENTEPASDLFYTESEVDAMFAINLKADSRLKVLQAIGSNVKAFPIATELFLNTTGALVDGQVYGALYYFEKETVVSHIGFNHGTPQAVYVSDGYNGASISSVNPTTGVATEITRTLNDGNFWKGGAFGKQLKALPAPVTLAPGLYCVMFVWNASATTTAPTIYQHAATSSVHTSLIPTVLKLIFTIATPNADLPTTVTLSALPATGLTQGTWLE